MPVVERNVDADRAWFAREVPCVGVAVDQRGADADRGGASENNQIETNGGHILVAARGGAIIGLLRDRKPQ